MKDRDSCNAEQVLYGKSIDLIMLLGDCGKEDAMFLSFADKSFKLLSFCFMQAVGRLPWILSCNSCESSWHTLVENLDQGHEPSWYREHSF